MSALPPWRCSVLTDCFRIFAKAIALGYTPDQCVSPRPLPPSTDLGLSRIDCSYTDLGPFRRITEHLTDASWALYEPEAIQHLEMGKAVSLRATATADAGSRQRLIDPLYCALLAAEPALTRHTFPLLSSFLRLAAVEPLRKPAPSSPPLPLEQRWLASLPQIAAQITKQRFDTRRIAINLIHTAPGRPRVRKLLPLPDAAEHAFFASALSHFTCKFCGRFPHQRGAFPSVLPFEEMLAHQHEYHNPSPRSGRVETLHFQTSVQQVGAIKEVLPACHVPEEEWSDPSTPARLDRAGRCLTQQYSNWFANEWRGLVSSGVLAGRSGLIFPLAR